MTPQDGATKGLRGLVVNRAPAFAGDRGVTVPTAFWRDP
jgi:hypothetical protein